ncbi:NTP pyrophosphohydrolase [Yinghuangia soli]|uniref:NTP pyrophosphohydrolase n=1 Tax=Yinghuangia soli TaxID=2908204 RepID=A0AA41Q276_9ACTN|nr:NTP pyrophosphohydrolase [Yinghuangia soli]MCF2530178.1 NTP pyrophosphohydrolase [Yinghuangia soli]
MSDEDPLLVVDAANVVGSVPDGWWRDRLGAATRLRDALVRYASDGLAASAGTPAWATEGPLHIVLVVEGAARGLTGVPDVAVATAPGSGDDEIVRIVAAARTASPDRRIAVITADRELRTRITAHDAIPLGPRTVHRR